MTGMAKAPDRWHRWVDFGERDLVRHAERAGFADINLELRVTVKKGKRPVPWEDALRMAVNPLAPPLGEVLDRVLSAQEIAMENRWVTSRPR